MSIEGEIWNARRMGGLNDYFILKALAERERVED